MKLGAKVKDKHVESAVSGLRDYLYEGEEPRLIVKLNKVNPFLDFMVVSNARVLAYYKADLGKKEPRISVLANQIAEFKVEDRKLSNPVTEILTKSGDKISFGQLIASKDDAPLVREAINQLLNEGVPPQVQKAIDEKNLIADGQALALAERQAAEMPDVWYQGITCVGDKPKEKARQAIIDHAAAGEKPWLLIGESAGGTLAAFNDRLMLAKVGAMTSFMSGAFGGGRLTTFHFDHITGIEYNANMFNGVLEVLTPSYQGTANKDYWRGTFNSRNADANDPFTLSNCLPLSKARYKEALPLLNEVRTKIAEYRKVSVQVEMKPVEGASSLADELTKLAALRDQGILTEADFESAKQAAIARAIR